MKKIVSLILSIAVLLTVTACSRNGAIQQKYTYSFLDLFDTASTVIAYDDSQEAFDRHIEQFYNELAEYDKLYDIYKSYDGINNLYVVNNEAGKAPVKVDSRIIDLLEYCKYVYDLSDGRTNVCFGSVLRLWHNSREQAYENSDNARLPDMNELKEASKHTNIDDLVIDKENSTVFFKDKDMKLDVGAVAKGYAVNEVTKWAKETLWSAAAISIGGNVSTFGYKENDGKTLWNISIESPKNSESEYLAHLSITDLTVVTSGDYQRYYTVDGKRYCHIINPETLMPSEYVASVSVVCDDSALGDALSTTLFNMPIDEGKRLVEGLDSVEAIWVDKNYNESYSSGFGDYIKK